MKKYIIKQWNAVKALHPLNLTAAVFLMAYVATQHDPLYMAGLFALMLYKIGTVYEKATAIDEKLKGHTVRYIHKTVHDNALTLMEEVRMAWSLKTFPAATPISALEKCREELMEVEVLLKHNPHHLDELATEYADALMCLMDSAQRAGLTVGDIFNAYNAKMEENKARTWHKNPDNSYSHNK